MPTPGSALPEPLATGPSTKGSRAGWHPERSAASHTHTGPIPPVFVGSQANWEPALDWGVPFSQLPQTHQPQKPQTESWSRLLLYTELCWPIPCPHGLVMTGGQQFARASWSRGESSPSTFLCASLKPGPFHPCLPCPAISSLCLGTSHLPACQKEL